MTPLFTATAAIEIHAPVSKVWNALVTPQAIKHYLFGTETECDWKNGSPIYFRGEYQGKQYEDKGIILKIEQNEILSYTYWSSMSNSPDLPENYTTVTYELSVNDASTILTLLQEGIKSEESKKHSEQNWKYVLEGLKKFVEGE